MVQHLSGVEALETSTSSSTNGNEKAIPLPPPPSSLLQLPNGNAYGGNQSFIQSSGDSIVGAPANHMRSSYWDTSGAAGSSSERMPGVVGLTNIGNTCFMNSGLQCLLNTPAISEFFIKSKPFVGSTSKLNQFALLNQFQIVVQETWYGQNNKINLQEFKSCLANIHSQFNDSRQHDCQEFLALLLDSLHEQLKKWLELQKGIESLRNMKLGSFISSATHQLTYSSENDKTASMKENINEESENGPRKSSTSISSLSRLPKMLGDSRNNQDIKSSTNSSIENTASLGDRPLKIAVHIKSPLGSKNKSLIRKRFGTSPDLKSKYQNIPGKPKGAQMSFTMPNFGPPKSNKNPLASSYLRVSSPVPGIGMENKKELKIAGLNGRLNIQRQRKKKLEEGESPECYKKTKLELSPKGGTDIKRKLEFTEDKGTCTTGSKSARVEADLFGDTNGCYPDKLEEVFNDCKRGVDSPDNHSYELPHTSPIRSSFQKEEILKANNFWNKHIEANNTVIAKTFQGLLKSTVICSTCNYNSVTYEPFMYLSLPFPRVLERQLTIDFISMKDRRPRRIEVTVSVMDTVQKVKEEVGKLVDDILYGSGTDKLVFAEVYNYNVQRFLDNTMGVRKLNDNRNLYMYDLNDNFEEHYSVTLQNGDTEDFGFSNTFISSETIGAVSSTTGSQMNATTYLNEDWDSETKVGASNANDISKEDGRNTSVGCYLHLDLEEQCPESEISSSTMPSGSQECHMDTIDESGDPADENALNVGKRDSECKTSISIPNLPSSASLWTRKGCGTEAAGGNSETEDSGLGSGSSDSTECSSGAGSVTCTKDINFNENDSVITPPSSYIDPDSGEKFRYKDGNVNATPEFCGSGEMATEETSDSSVPDLLPAEGCITHDLEACSTKLDENDVNDHDWKSNDFDEVEHSSSDTLQCIICLEDCAVKDMRQHVNCDCIICSACVRSSIQHFVDPSGNLSSPIASENKLKCATCMKIVDGAEFVQYKTAKDKAYTKVTAELVSVVFRNDPLPETNNNSSQTTKLFGYPWLLKVPSVIPAIDFYNYMSKINPFPHLPYKLLNVSTDGKSCGQCLYASRCRGCELPGSGAITFRSRFTVAMVFANASSDLIDSIDPADMAIEENSFASSQWVTSNEPNYDIHDCLRAFSEKEHLDEQNPWYCPKCEKSRCATKALSVCHFPDYLIVYLKRFVFLDHSSNKLNNKLRFPTDDLDLGEYIAEECSGKQWKYDLYGCICHFGSVSSGHYTAYGKNPVSKEWHYFNDDIVSSQCPKDLEHSSAYVLFYSRKGVKFDIPVQSKGRLLPGLTTLSTNTKMPATIAISDDTSWELDTDGAVSSSCPMYGPEPYPGTSKLSDTIEEMSLVSTRERTPEWNETDTGTNGYDWDDDKDPSASDLPMEENSEKDSLMNLAASSVEKYGSSPLLNGHVSPNRLESLGNVNLLAKESPDRILREDSCDNLD